MKLVVNTIPLLSPLTGIGKYTWQICRAMQDIAAEHAYCYYYGYYSDALFCAQQGKLGATRIKDVVKNIPLAGRGLRLLKGMGALLSHRQFDVYFEPNYVPLQIKSKKTVVAVPDLSPFLHPEWHPNEAVEYFRSHFRRNIGRADQIIVISDFIRDTAIAEFGFRADQVTTIHLGYDRELFHPRAADRLAALKQSYQLPERFMLYVGSIEPRKNLVRLLKAYRQLPASLRSEVKLVLAGFRGWDNAEVMVLLDSMQQDVTYLGYVAEAELAGLYNLAEFFVYPALYEGFGLPPLEAMASGCPVVVSRVASLPEVCGDAAAYIDPLQIDDISETLLHLCGNRTKLQELRNQGLQQAASFSWERSAREHLAVFET